MKKIKRLAIMAAVLMALVWLGTTTAPAANEHWNQYAAVNLGASADTNFVPTFLGAPFRGKKISISGLMAAGSGVCSLTVYQPLTAGPSSATDSTLIVFYVQSLTGSPMNHYFDVSDTIRVRTVASMTATVTVYGN